MGETVAEAGWRRQDEVAWRENLEVALYLRVGLGAVDDRAIGVGPVRGANLKLSLWSGLAACQVNFVEPLGKYLDRLSARQSSRQGSRRRSGDLRRRTASARLPATHISATTAEAILGSNFVASLVASFVDTSRSRFVTIRPVVSSLFDPATCWFSAADAKDCVPPGTGFIGDGFGGRQSLGASAAMRRRPRTEVSSLLDPASLSAAGGLADLKLSLWSGLAGDEYVGG